MFRWLSHATQDPKASCFGAQGFGENVVGMCLSQDHSIRPHRFNHKRGQVFRLNDKRRNRARYYRRLVWSNDKLSAKIY